MKLYILADRLNKSLDEVFKAIEKLNLNIKSAEQNLTHEEVMKITKYFAEKRRFSFFILLWGYVLSFLSAFSILFKKRGYFYGVCTGIVVFTFVAINAPNQSNEIVVTDTTTTSTTTVPSISVETSIFITDGTSTSTTSVPPTTTTSTTTTSVPPTTTTSTTTTSTTTTTVPPTTTTSTTTTTVPPTTTTSTTTTSTTTTSTTTTTLPPTDLITNGSFELPDPGTSGNFANSEVPGWTNQLVDLSTETRIEIWKKGERSNDANEGNYHIELNWSAASSIYQDVSVSPGDEIDWSFAHRGRQGVDTISFRLGAPGSEVEIGQYSSGKNQWSIYSGTYTVPDGVTTLRVRFHHISVAGGDGGGNHLDSIEIINNY